MLSFVCYGALAVRASPVAAVQLGDPDNVLSIEIHAFGSQGFMVSTGNNYLASNTTHGSFEFTEVGLNFTKQLTDKLRAGFQLFTRRIGPIGDFNIKADWFYLDYRWKDWLGFRAGRTKLPFGLYNDVNDIDAARVPILLPQSLYPIQDRDFLLALTGGEIYGWIPLRKAGQLEYRLYGGTLFIDLSSLQTSPGTSATSLRVPYIAGGRLMWDTPLNGLRMGGSVQALRIDTTLLLNTGAGALAQSVEFDLPVVLWVASVEYVAHRLLLAAEYSRWSTTTHSNNTMLIPDQSQTNERAYVMAAYRVNRWFQPGVYYSSYLPNAYKRSGGRATMQQDAAATLRFDVNPFWLIKLEGHFMNGTAGLDSTLNSNMPLTALDRYWGFFLVKTTVYF